MTQAAQIVTPPLQGRINALAIAITASAGTLVTDPVALTTSSEKPTYWTFVADTRIGIIFGESAAAITDPDLAAVVGDGRCWTIEAGQEAHFWIAERSRFFKYIGEAVGILRFYNS